MKGKSQLRRFYARLESKHAKHPLFAKMPAFKMRVA